MDDRLSKLEGIVASQQETIAALAARIEALENIINPASQRHQTPKIKVFGFSIVKSGQYWLAVKRIDGDLCKIYLGKDMDSMPEIKAKIVAWLLGNPGAKESLLKKNPSLAPEIADIESKISADDNVIGS